MEDFKTLATKEELSYKQLSTLQVRMVMLDNGCLLFLGMLNHTAPASKRIIPHRKATHRTCLLPDVVSWGV